MSTALCQLLYVDCSMSTALCQLLYVNCSMSTALCRMLYVDCSMSTALCQLLYVERTMLYVERTMLYVDCTMLYVDCTMLYVDCTMLYVDCFVPRPTGPPYGIIHRSGNAATKIDITKSACFNTRIQLDGLNVYKTDASYKGNIFGLFSMLEKASEKSVLLFVKRPTV